MYLALISHINNFVALEKAEEETIIACLGYRTVKKKENLLEEGQVCNRQYFVVKGFLRSYIVNQKGTEQTTQFAIENWWLTDYLSFESKKPSHFYIQAVEPAEVISIDKKSLDELLEKIPKLERYFRIVMQKAFAAAQMRIKFLFTQSAEERYHHFNTSFPSFVQRVPQYMLASYLDFTPEFMSKIRAGKT